MNYQMLGLQETVVICGGRLALLVRCGKVSKFESFQNCYLIQYGVNIGFKKVFKGKMCRYLLFFLRYL